MRATDIPLDVLLERARRQRGLLLAGSSEWDRFRVSEANHVAQLDAVISWLESVPGCEWICEYLEVPLPRRGGPSW